MLNTAPWGHWQVRQRKKTQKEHKIRVEQGKNIIIEFKGEFKKGGLQTAGALGTARLERLQLRNVSRLDNKDSLGWPE